MYCYPYIHISIYLACSLAEDTFVIIDRQDDFVVSSWSMLRVDISVKSMKQSVVWSLDTWTDPFSSTTGLLLTEPSYEATRAGMLQTHLSFS